MVEEGTLRKVGGIGQVRLCTEVGVVVGRKVASARRKVQRNFLQVRGIQVRGIQMEGILTSKSDTSTGTRGLVHLTEDEGDLGVTVKLNDGSLLHLVVQIVTLTGTLTDTSEDGETTVGLGDVVLSAVS